MYQSIILHDYLVILMEVWKILLKTFKYTHPIITPFESLLPSHIILKNRLIPTIPDPFLRTIPTSPLGYGTSHIFYGHLQASLDGPFRHLPMHWHLSLPTLFQCQSHGSSMCPYRVTLYVAPKIAPKPVRSFSCTRRSQVWPISE